MLSSLSLVLICFSLILLSIGKLFSQSKTTCSGSFSLSQTSPYFLRSNSFSCFSIIFSNSSLERQLYFLFITFNFLFFLQGETQHPPELKNPLFFFWQV